jgi:long-chain acyl-CoA synthetase
MNSTMKMVRPKITERYMKELEYLYTPEAKNILNTINRTAIENILK